MTRGACLASLKFGLLLALCAFGPLWAATPQAGPAAGETWRVPAAPLDEILTALDPVASDGAAPSGPAALVAALPQALAQRPAVPVAAPRAPPPGGVGGLDPLAAPAPVTGTSQAVRIVLGLTLLAVLPALLVCLTSFLRIIVVLSMLRHALGMQETPPNTVLIGLALFLTLFTMAPVLEKINHDAFQPFMAGSADVGQVLEKGAGPLREFMVRQTREQDIALMIELAKAKTPQNMEEVSNVQLMPAYMLSELRAGFQIGFVIFLPFLLIDLIVSSILMALGMMMMPPTTISMPLKILMFILIDGWSLVLKALVGSFH